MLVMIEAFYNLLPNYNLTSNAFSDALESDEDEIDVEGEDYLVSLGEKVTKAALRSPFSISFSIQVF